MPPASPAPAHPSLPQPDRSRLFLLLLSGLVLLAWAALWAWSLSPWDRYLAHDRWDELGQLAQWCRAVPQGEWLLPALLHGGAWLLMIAAMMLPTLFPLVRMFGQMVAPRGDAAVLLWRVVLGYLLAWFGFGLLAHGVDAGLHRIAAGSDWMFRHGWAIGALVLGGAGLFQFSALKYRCLDRCRTPFGFINQHWRGRAPGREALRLGLAHGLFCVGCCWALMLLMFVVGTGNPGWMLAIGAVMAAEKNLPSGRRLSTPLGVALLAAAAVEVLHRL